MSKNRWKLLLGIWLILLPFLGISPAIRKYFLIATGLIVIVLAFRGFAIRRRKNQTIHLPINTDESNEIRNEV